MDIKKFKELSDKVPEEHLPLMGLVNQKLDNDMEKAVIRLEAAINGLGAKIDTVETKLESKINAVEKSLKSEVSNTTRMLWYFIGAIIVAIAAAIGSKWLGH